MDFSYLEEHLDLKKLSGEIMTDFSESERLKKLEADGPYIDNEAWQQLVSSGIHGASLNESLGGMAMDFTAACLVAEELGKTVLSIPYIPSVISTALPLQDVDDEKLQSVLSAFAAGETLISAALVEPGNDDPFSCSLTAQQEGDNWQLNGSKHLVPYAKESSTLLINAKVNGQAWLGLIDTDAHGVNIIEQRVTSGEPQYKVELDSVNAHCIAQGQQAEQLLQKSIAMSTAAYCAMAVGTAERMTKIGAEYTSQREQFGAAIATFQAVAHRLANCYIDTDCLKIITTKAISDVNNGDHNHESLLMAKTWCGDVLHRVSHAVQHVHGGAGIDKDYHLFRYCQWSKHLELTMGNSKQHMNSIADRLEQQYLALVS